MREGTPQEEHEKDREAMRKFVKIAAPAVAIGIAGGVGLHELGYTQNKEVGTVDAQVQKDTLHTGEQNAFRTELFEEIGRLPNAEEMEIATYFSEHNMGDGLRALVQEMKQGEISHERIGLIRAYTHIEQSR